MQKQYIQYLGQFKPLVQLIGQKTFTSKVEEYLNSIDIPMKNTTNIVQQEKINLAYQRDSRNISTPYNQNGILKFHWIDKQLKYKPSVVVKIYDWTKPISQEAKSWDQKLNEIQTEYWNIKKDLLGRRGQGQTKIMVIIYFGQNAGQPGGDQIFSRLKELLDLDTKKLYLVSGDLDSISTCIRKVRKNIEELSKSFYESLHKKYKKQIIAKPQTSAQKQKNIKYSIKLGIINEIQAIQKGYDKSQKQHALSYQCIKEELQYNFQQGCNLAVYRKQQNINNMNFDAYHSTQKLQELRYLGDLIMFRLLQLSVMENKIKQCFEIFEFHFKEFKSKVLNYDFRFNFTEYKWREEIFKQFTYIALELFHNNEKILKDNKDILLRFFNILIASVIYGQERYEMFKMIQNSINKDQQFEVIVSPDLYFGRNNYQLINSSKKVNDMELEAERLLQECLELSLIQESETSILNENFTVLNLGYELKHYLNPRQVIQIRFYLLKNYSLTENFDQFKIVAEDLIAPSIQYKMKDILVYIIEKYEKFLQVWNLDNEKQIKYNLDLLLLKSESIEDKQKRLQTQTQGTVDICFITENNNIEYKGCRDSVYLDRVESRIIINTQISNPLYINELFEINVLLRKEDKNPKEKIQNVQVALIADNSKNQLGKNSLQMFYLAENNTNQKKKYQDSQQFQVSFPDQEIAKSISFYIRANYTFEEIVKIEVNYELISDNKVKKRRISGYQKIQIIDPFLSVQEWKVCNDAYLNQQCKNNNAPNAPEQILPFKQLCSQKFIISVTDQPLWIHQIQYNINPQDNFQIVKKHELQKPIKIDKGDQYSFNLFIKTIKEIKDIPIGNLVIMYNRNETIKEQNELNQYTFRLSNITVISNKYKINIEAPTHIQVGEFFNMSFKITNTQQKLVRLEICAIENKDRKDFIIAGKTKRYIELDSNNTYEYDFKLLSLECGQLKLPGIQINSFISNQDKMLISDSSGLKQIIVLP